MSLQYLSDENGQIVAVQVPIEDWELLRRKYPEIEAPTVGLPDWQKDLIDSRLKAIEESPDRILPIDSLMAELDRSQE
jgi:hypothetical protein